MKIKSIIEQAGISPRTWQYLMAGKRNASPRTAVKLESVTGISRQVWVFGTGEDRQDAWKKFNEPEGKK